MSILLALAIRAWWDGTQDQRTEQLYLERLSTDLRSDTATYRFTLAAVERKVAALGEVARILRSGDEVSDTTGFIQPVELSAVFGGAMPRQARATIDDLLNTGRLSVIASAELRTRIPTSPACA